MRENANLHISNRAICTILGEKKPLALSFEEMAKNLRVTFFPGAHMTSRVKEFVEKLRQAFVDLGIEIIPYEKAIKDQEEGRIKEGIVMFSPGEADVGNFALDHVSSLYDNPVVGIYDGPFPADERSSLQTKLDAIVKVLTWNLVHIAIFVDESSWTLCTMNGGIVRFEKSPSLKEDVLRGMTPKLAASVRPPRVADIIYRQGALDTSSGAYNTYVEDFMSSGKVWAESGLMLSHTSVESLKYRDVIHKMIVRSFLDGRTGMSYGFLSWQLPTPAGEVLTLSQAEKKFGVIDWDKESAHQIDDKLYVQINLKGESYLVEVPDVAVLSTRSGCNKTNLDPERDIVRMCLSKGKVIFEMPKGISSTQDCKPSYDTITILGHAVGNAMVAGILAKVNKGAKFPNILRTKGLSLSHWHSYLKHGELPSGYFMHGSNNPAVLCSTPQSAVFALAGKFEALQAALVNGGEYLGDVHMEPHHGTNITGTMSLTETAQWLYQVSKRAK